jgi:FKBP-type peptidyl-prolyl cis-trans isomerase
MKKHLLLLCGLFVLVLYACTKNQTVAQATVDDEKIQKYLTTNNITMTKDPSGVYYRIIKAGTGAYPTATDTVKSIYSFSFLNGQVVQTAVNFNGVLNSTVAGFQTGVEHINSGGRVEFIIPSGLAYGPAGDGSTVPANAILYYTVDLQGFY